MEFTILGRTRLYVGGQAVPLGPTKQRALLALLLVYGDRPVTVDTIVGQLWKGRDRDETRSNLQTLISRLRQVLKRAEVPGSIDYDNGAYRLRLDPQLVDYYRFRRRLDQGKTAAAEGDHAQARRLLRDAIGMWRGEPLADLRTGWADQRRKQMVDHDLLPAHCMLLSSELALGEYDEVLRQLVPLMDEWPLDEILARHHMQALDGRGRYAEATDFYARFRQRLRHEYGAEPGPELRELYHQVQRKRAPAAQESASTPAVTPLELGAPCRLPRRPSNFTGRDDLLATLDALFLDAGLDVGGHAPVVALHGMPAAGKTALAVHWAHHRQHHFPDGSLFLNLNGYSPDPPITADVAMAMFLGALGVPADQVPPAGEQRTARLSQELTGHRLLMILDNARDPASVRPLLAATSNCPVIITSRAWLTELAVSDNAERVFVPPLSIEESVALLRREIADTRVDDDPAALRQLADRSYGLPLAIKVIGQYTANRPRTSLVGITHEFDSHTTLVSAAPESDDETAALSRVFGLSYSALPCETARLFHTLGLHPGPEFSSHAAAALSAKSLEETEQELKVLCGVHLLAPEGLYRYRFHDLLHAYAASRADHDESAESHHASLTSMVDWYLGTASAARQRLAAHADPVPPVSASTDVTPLTFDTDALALEWCHQERGNLLAVTRRAAEYGLHEQAWRIPATLHEVLERTGFQDDFLETTSIALESAHIVRDRVAEVTLLNCLGRIQYGRHEYHHALNQFLAGLAIATKAAYPAGQAASQHNLASTYLELGDLDSAIQIYGQTIRLDRELGDPDGEAHGLNRLAHAYRRKGQYEKALEYYREALRIRREIGHLRGQGNTLTELALLHYQQREYDQALGYCHQALEIHSRSGDKTKAGNTLTTLAAVCYDTQQYSEAVRNGTDAADLYTATGDSIAVARTFHLLGHAWLALGEPGTTKQTWLRALDLLDDEHPQAVAIRSHLGSNDADDTVSAVLCRAVLGIP